MLDLSLEEAQLFRMLAEFFGSERVIPQMSALAVCGGELPEGCEPEPLGMSCADLTHWAKRNRCLFTIVDSEGDPRMVVEFGSGTGRTIDAERLEHSRMMGPLLAAAGIRYITMTDEEFLEIRRPSGNLDFVSFLKGRFENFGYSFGPSESE